MTFTSSGGWFRGCGVVYAANSDSPARITTRSEIVPSATAYDAAQDRPAKRRSARSVLIRLSWAGPARAGGRCYVFRRKSSVAGKSGFSSMGGTVLRPGVWPMG